MDLRKVKKLIDLMEVHGLAEVEVEAEGEKIRLRKQGEAPVGISAVSIPMPAPIPLDPGRAVAAGPMAAPATGETAAKKPSETVEIVSPMVGTFYRSSAPDSDSFVSVGDKVDDETVVCIIEAMKVMNTIKAEVTGEIVAILVENGEAVEYGQPLFAVRPAAKA